MKDYVLVQDGKETETIVKMSDREAEERNNNLLKARLPFKWVEKNA